MAYLCLLGILSEESELVLIEATPPGFCSFQRLQQVIERKRQPKNKLDEERKSCFFHSRSKNCLNLGPVYMGVGDPR